MPLPSLLRKLMKSVGLDTLNFTLRQPIGVVGCISPWNLPLICLPGKSPRPSQLATPWSPNPVKSRPWLPICWAKSWQRLGFLKGFWTLSKEQDLPLAAIVEHPGIKIFRLLEGLKPESIWLEQRRPYSKTLIGIGRKNRTSFCRLQLWKKKC